MNMPGGRREVGGQHGARVNVNFYLCHIVLLAEQTLSLAAHPLYGFGEVEHPGELAAQVEVPPGALDDGGGLVGSVAPTVASLQHLRLSGLNLRAYLTLKEYRINILYRYHCYSFALSGH